MSFDKKVVLAGATGNLGPSLLAALLSASYKVTVLARAKSASSVSPQLQQHSNLRTVAVDYDAPETVSAAIAGHSAVIAALPMDAAGTAAQHALIDACLSAGVPRFVPSAFGSDMSDTLAAELPVHAGKVDIHRRLEGLQAGKLEWASIACGPFLDWCIMVGVFLEAKAHKVTYYDGGNMRFSSTTLPHVGAALVRVLDQWRDVKNRVVRVHDGVFTQRQLVKIAQAVQADITGTSKITEQWTEEHSNTADGERAARARLEANGELGNEEAYAFLKRAIWGEGYGADMTGKVDNEALGLGTIGDDELKEVVAAYC